MNQPRSDLGTLKLKDSELKKAQAKHEYFLNLLRQGAEAVPELRAIAESLADAKVIDEINSELTRGQAKPTDKTTIALASPLRFIVESDVWHDWWRSFRGALTSKRHEKRKGAQSIHMLCYLTGSRVTPAMTLAPVHGLGDVGGSDKNGDGFGAFNQPAFGSYGLLQAANSAMEESAWIRCRDALELVIRKHGRRLAGVKIVHWFAGEKPVPREDDPFEMLSDPGVPDGERGTDLTTEAVAQSRASRLLESIRAGQRADLLGYRFYALTLSGNAYHGRPESTVIWPV